MEFYDQLVRGFLSVQRRLTSDRGDVPGWVMITVMTAAIAMVLWGVASNTFQRIFNDAFNTIAPK